ncbi:hypothetical protein ACFRLW_23885 [Streptomyces sp. NPDC056728]
MQERGEQRTVGPGELRLANLPLQHGQLMAQRQDFGVLAAVAHRQEPYPGEHALQGQVRQSQEHRIILAPDGTRWQSPAEALTVTADWHGPATMPTRPLTSTGEDGVKGTGDCLAHRFGNAADRPNGVRRCLSDMTDAEWVVVRNARPVPARLEGRGGQPETGHGRKPRQ